MVFRSIYGNLTHSKLKWFHFQIYCRNRLQIRFMKTALKKNFLLPIHFQIQNNSFINSQENLNPLFRILLSSIPYHVLSLLIIIIDVFISIFSKFSKYWYFTITNSNSLFDFVIILGIKFYCSIPNLQNCKPITKNLHSKP